MTTSHASQTVTATLPVRAPEFVCAEVWGGNRPVDTPLKLPGIRGKVYSHPCHGGRGGDIHYVSICNSGLTSRLCLADVVGHGEAVAQVSSEIHALLRRYMNNHDETRVLADLNKRLIGRDLRSMTTAASVSYLPPMRLLAVSYAGHPPGWLYRKADDAWSRLEVHAAAHHDHEPLDLPLAIDPDSAYSRRRLRVRAGDRVLLVTDGVLEAPSPAGGLYGDKRLTLLLEQHRGATIEELVDRIVADVVAFTRDPGLSHDDVTLLGIEFTPGPKAFGIWTLLKNQLLGPQAQRRR